MKIAIVTFVRAYNYGAVLQCYALSQTLNKMGHDVEVIDYFPDYFRDLYRLAYLGEPRYMPFRPIKSWVKFSKVWTNIKKRNNKFDEFLNKYIPITHKQYRNFKELNDETFNYDLYISGSDQVWSDKCANFDPTFFLQFKSAKTSSRASYAASFGFNNIPHNLQNEYKKRLINWKAYSVREPSGVSILTKLLNKRPMKCCDPSLLLSSNEWDNIKSPNNHNKPYIFIYTVNGYDIVFEYAQKLSSLKNLRVVFVSACMHHKFFSNEITKKYNFINRPTTSPQEIIDLFSNASYVLTDSFHGTVFSILYHKKFLSLVSACGFVNNRVVELFEELDIKNREISDNNFNKIDDAINWDIVDDRINNIRCNAISYLNNLTQFGD